MRLSLSHPDISKELKTYVSQSAGILAGDTSVSVRNTSDISVNDYLVVGALGQSQTEIVRVTSITNATTLAVTAFSFPHEDDTPLTIIRYNQFKVYLSTTGSTGSYSLQTTKGLMVDEPLNIYNDPNAQSNYYYKFTYYNSQTSTESDYSAAIPASGFTFQSNQYMQSRVLNLFGDVNEEKVKRSYIQDWFNEFTERVQFKIAGGSTGRWVASNDVALNSATSVDISSYKFIHIFLVEFSSDGVTFDKVLAPSDFREDLDTADFRRPVYAFFKQIDQKLYFDSNSPLTGTLRIWAFTSPSRFGNDTDEPPTPLTYSSEVYVNYGLQRAYEKDRKFDNAAYFEKRVQGYMDEIIPLIKAKLRMGKYYMNLPFLNQY